MNDVLSRVYLLSMLWNTCPTWAPLQAEVGTSILPITGKHSLLGTSCSVSTICWPHDLHTSFEGWIRVTMFRIMDTIDVLGAICRPGTICSFAAP